MEIIFRVDSSNNIGGGHLTRCINIANQLKNKEVNSIFLCQDLPKLWAQQSDQGKNLAKMARAGFSYDICKKILS